MVNIMDFWRNEWKSVGDCSMVTDCTSLLKDDAVNNKRIKGGWYKDSNNNIKWTDSKTKQDFSNTDIEGDYLGNAVVLFNGSLKEKLGSKKKGGPGYDGKHTDGYIDGEEAVTADVTVYVPCGKTDIKQYIGFSMSSDFDTYGAIDNDEYSLDYDKDGKSGALQSHWALNKRGKVKALNGNNPNPYSELNGTPYKNGIFIHSTNSSGYAGTYKKGTEIRGISEGCLLIIPSLRTEGNGWNEFNKQLDGVKKGTVIVERS